MNWKYCPFCGGSLQQAKDFTLCAGCGKRPYVNPKSTTGILLFDSSGKLVLTEIDAEPEYIDSSYLEVEFMGYATPVNWAVYCAVLINDELVAYDDVAGFVRLARSEFDPEKQAWSMEISPLTEKGFEWMRAKMIQTQK